ncbi:MAG: ATP-binding cassette domain-containing protein [Lachnospiraceae bacterium]|nr:ATP-binding cassette domain-containing protein [Lachnospiraceae bacterium]
MSVDVNVKKKYSDFELDVSFSVTGSRIGILGASGCGKTLTLRAIAGLMHPDEGMIRLNERVVFDSSQKINIKPQKRNIGYLFQEYALFPNMTVKGNIEAGMLGSSSKDIDELLKKYGLWDVIDHRPDSLSGGQKQRCALLRMLVSDPQLILLDEPFSAMDAHLREKMRLELISILDGYDRTVILVSHDRDEIYQMCDHLVLMDNGKVIARGATEDVFKNPGTVAAARLTGCKNISAIVKMGDHNVRALAWNNIELETADVITEDITHIGIRAHDFIPQKTGKNAIRCQKTTVSRLPFEWYVTLDNGLWWKYPRQLGEPYSDSVVPPYISIEPDKIILLSD